MKKNLFNSVAHIYIHILSLVDHKLLISILVF